MDSTNNVLRNNSRTNAPQSSNSDPLEKAEEIVATATTTEPDLDAKADSEAHKAALITAIRNSDIPDLVWLWEFDPPPVSLDPAYPESIRDNKISTFAMPEQWWKVTSELLTCAAGRSLAKSIKGLHMFPLTGDYTRHHSDGILQGVANTFWALDLIGQRTPVKGNYAAVDMHWRSEINQLLSLMERAGERLTEEEENELCSVACLLRAQMCPRSSDRSLAWANFACALANTPEKVRQNRKDRNDKNLQARIDLANRFYEQQERG